MSKPKAERAREQLRGTKSNARDLVGDWSLDQILPNALVGIIAELMMLIPNALGRNGPKKQVYASTTLIILAFLSTPFTLGYSALLALLPALTLMVGMVRLVPAANSRFRDVRGSKLRNRDAPLWKRD